MQNKKEEPNKGEEPKINEKSHQKKKDFTYPDFKEKVSVIHDFMYQPLPEAAGGVAEREKKGDGKNPDTVRVELIKLRANPKITISSPNDVHKAVGDMEDLDREYAKVIYMDAKNRVIGIENVAEGTLNSAAMTPREVVKGATLASAARAIFVHNHPSGISQPSNEDIQFTQNLVNAFALMGIELTDSIVVGKEGIYSFNEWGKMPKPNPAFMDITMIQDDTCAVAVRAALEILDEKCSKPK